MCGFVHTRDLPGYTVVRERSYGDPGSDHELSAVEQRQLAQWFEEALELGWDNQIKADVASGRLNDLIASAEAEIAAGSVKRLDEILGDR